MAFIFHNQRVDEGRKEYLAKYAGEPGVDGVVDRFWALRHRIAAPENDIDWWIKKPYSDLKRFVQGFDYRSRSQRRADAHAAEAERHGAKMLGMSGPYEVWWIPSHEAAQEIGRLYKGKSAEWCISTENPEYFNSDYAGREFVFMILAEGKAELDGFDKLAIEMSLSYSGKVTVHEIWDSGDDRAGDRPDYLENDDMIKLVDKAVDMFQKSGLSRGKYWDEQASKVAGNPVWLRDKLFKDPGAKIDTTGGATVECELDVLDDIIEDKRECVSPEFVKKIIEGEWFDAFYPPEEPSFEYMDKAEKAFEEIAGQYGAKWSDLEKIWDGREEYVEWADQSTLEWMKDALYEDFYEGNSYASVWSDCWVDGTGQEAREDILGELNTECGVDGYKWSERKRKTLLVFKFSRADVLRMAKLRLRGNAEDAPLLAVMNEDDGEVQKAAIYEPQYGWSGFNQDMMAEAAASFARRLAGQITKQKDAPGQTFLPIDKVDNPDNLSEG